MRARLLVLAVLALSALAIALAAPPYRWVGVGQLVLTAAAAAWRPQAAARWAVANTTVIIALAILVACRLPLMLVACLVLTWLAVFRAWTAQGDGGLQVILLLALLQGILCTRLIPGEATQWIFVGLILMGAMALARIQQRSTPLMLLALGLGIVSLGAGRMVPGQSEEDAEDVQEVGFSREVSLGDLGPLHDDLTLLAQLRTEASLPEEVYLRGVILDRFTGSSWVSSTPPEHTPAPPAGDGALHQHRLLLAPLTEGVLLGVPSVVEMAGDGVDVWRDHVGTWRYIGPVQPVAYTTWSAETVAPDPLQEPGRWLGLPAEMDPRIRSLAAQLAQEASVGQLGQVGYTEAWLRENYTYTRLPVASTERQALSDFLFDSRAGHCEYFATALAVLLRAQGLAARVVTGVRGVEQTPEGVRMFRQRDAHAWVEVFRDGQGWVGVDATPPELRTPPPLRRAPSGLSAGAGGGVGPVWTRLAAGLAGLGVLGGAIVLARHRRQDPLLRRYQQARRLIVRRGWKVPPSLPPVAAGEWLVEQAGERGRPLGTIARLLYQSRYGGHEPAALIPSADEALQGLRKLPYRSGRREDST